MWEGEQINLDEKKQVLFNTRDFFEIKIGYCFIVNKLVGIVLSGVLDSSLNSARLERSI